MKEGQVKLPQLRVKQGSVQPRGVGHRRTRAATGFPCSATLITPDAGTYKTQLADYVAKRASSYDIRNTHHPELALELVKRAQLQPGWCVLDIASGTGLVAVQASKAVGGKGRVLGLDSACAMLQQVSPSSWTVGALRGFMILLNDSSGRQQRGPTLRGAPMSILRWLMLRMWP